MSFDPYKILGVDSTATYAEIKAAHRAQETVQVSNEEIAAQRCAYAMLDDFEFDVEKINLLSSHTTYTITRPQRQGPITWE